MEIRKTAKINNAEIKKTDILTRTIRTGVFTNSVIILFCVSLNFAFFAENKAKKQQIQILNVKTGPSIS